MFSVQAEPPKILGMVDNKFGPCPDKPNCVSTQAEKGQKQFLIPIKYSFKKDRAMQKMEEMVLKLPRMKLIKKDGDYFHFTSTSRLMGFVDDLEIYFGDPGLIHLKSSSRSGYYDFGVNKSRLTDLSFKFIQSGP